MPSLSTEKIVILDYSGTLSLDAPRFGTDANLLNALSVSGLLSLGITTPKFFWDEIVAPTWSAGSTTPIGYKQIIADRIDFLGLSPKASAHEISEAASRFVDLYLAHSAIAPLWRPILENMVRLPCIVIVATDHYAEATDAIVGYLLSWNIPSQRIGEPGRSSRCHVANSADIGFWKANPRFWEIVKSQLALESAGPVLAVDDFGFNEEQGDIYGGRIKAEARQNRTHTVLREVFGTEVEVISFSLKTEERNRKEASVALIAETAQKINIFLNIA